MQEILEQVLDYLKGIWLKRRYIMIATWLICPIGWIMVSQLDDTYKSQARVYADTQSILRPLLRGLTVETNPETQLKLMVKTLLSRTNLERIARMTDLDINANNPEQFDAIINQLKKGIKISQSRGRGDNIFTISYNSKDPEIAKNVVQSALTVFIENTLGSNRRDNDSAQEFLDSQIKEYEARLNEAESKVTSFKQKYNDILPGSGGYYSQLKEEKNRLEIAELELKELKTQLTSAKQQLADSNQQSGTLSDNIEDSSRVATSYDERIKTIENNLDGLLLRFTDKHPDVVEAQRLLNNLKDSRKEELENYYASIAKDNNNGQNTHTLSSNPIYQEMQIQVNQLENATASLEVRVNNYRNKVTDLENRIHTIPEIEQELEALNRGYDITKRKYNDLLSRKETASLAQSANDNTNKIEFRVIDPPRAASEPAGPNRLLFFVGVTAFAFAAGIGLSFLFSQLNPVVTSASQVSRTTGIPIFGIVSATENLGLKKWHQRKTLIFIVSNTVLILLLIGFISFFMFPDLIQAPLQRVF